MWVECGLKVRMISGLKVCMISGPDGTDDWRGFLSLRLPESDMKK